MTMYTKKFKINLKIIIQNINIKKKIKSKNKLLNKIKITKIINIIETIRTIKIVENIKTIKRTKTIKTIKKRKFKKIKNRLFHLHPNKNIFHLQFILICTVIKNKYTQILIIGICRLLEMEYKIYQINNQSIQIQFILIQLFICIHKIQGVQKPHNNYHLGIIWMEQTIICIYLQLLWWDNQFITITWRPIIYR